MKISLYSLIILFSIGLMSCQPSPKETEAKEETYVPETLVQKSVEAHGGFAKWKSYKTLKFDWFSGEGEDERRESIITQLHTRHEKISGKGYSMGYDGKDYWQKLEEGMKEKNTTFMINLHFYFFAMPFVLADPGVNEESLGRQTVDGKEYEVVKTTFDAGIGVASEDQYILYLDPETYQMEIMLYSVTYFNKENATKYSANKYTDWEEVDGLLMPKTIMRYYWDAENNTLGKERGKRSFDNISFSTEDPGTEMFVAPEGALVAE